MKTPYENRKGFTLIEIMIAIGILALIASLGLAMDLSFLKSDILQAEQSIIVSGLEKTRSRSMNNMFASPHGFCYVSPNYVIFYGRLTCLPLSATDELIGSNITISDNPSSTFPAVIVFSQLAGTTTSATIHITDGLKSKDININYEGRIDW